MIKAMLSRRAFFNFSHFLKKTSDTPWILHLPFIRADGCMPESPLRSFHPSDRPTTILSIININGRRAASFYGHGTASLSTDCVMCDMSKRNKWYINTVFNACRFMITWLYESKWDIASCWIYILGMWRNHKALQHICFFTDTFVFNLVLRRRDGGYGRASVLWWGKANAIKGFKKTVM